MQIPEQIYAEWRSQKSGVIPRIYYQKFEHTQNAAVMTEVLMNVPEEFDFLLTNVGMVIKPGAGVTATYARLYVEAGTDTQMFVRINNWGDAGAAVEYAEDARCQVWIESGDEVKVQAVFSGAHASNRLQVYPHGWLIPRMAV